MINNRETALLPQRGVETQMSGGGDGCLLPSSHTHPPDCVRWRLQTTQNTTRQGCIAEPETPRGWTARKGRVTEALLKHVSLLNIHYGVFVYDTSFCYL